ncbi:dTDP-4-dehydrorhamnose 3,5-epimerase [Paenibacillus harenae]|uniref:dTDP-4-dehydrorhamnose 3,5-epimerase n=1 Tax=Paenibacillus harenae TaxID=306543 RepID=UPI002793F62D|nr:dTDP-4-dehydrorhamnose 3,5-epimerase [Paenibacillus harenae]MDQ0062052.1 dTDP-4-dehydrorhamnose 3,5-epimerase [Paenibacillus harenae]
MKFIELELPGVYIIELEPISDERGFFARSWCIDEFEKHGLNTKLVQCNVSYNHRKGTLRGMHYQTKPFEEAKLVRCIRGSIYDVILDLRPDSAAFGKWVGVELTQNNSKMVYIAEGCAHGFQTLEDETEVFYQMSEFYQPEYGAGVRWDDAAFQIHWPLPNPIMNDKDINYPYWQL